MLFGVNQRPRSLVRDICKNRAAERRFLRKRVIGVCLLLCFSPEGKTGCFPLKKSGRFVFAEQKRETVRKADSFQNKSFACGERRFKSKKKSRLAGNKFASGRNKNLIRSQSRLARRDWRPLWNANGRVRRFAEKGDWRRLLA